MKKILSFLIVFNIFYLLLLPVSYCNEKIGKKKISMDFKDANLKDVLKIFSQQSGLNFIASQEIKDRKVTLYMENVPVNDALNTILTANNLTYKQPEGTNIFIVKQVIKPRVETITRIYQLNNANAEDVKKLFEKMSEVKKIKETTAEGKEETKTEISSGGLISQYGKIASDKRTNSLIVTDIPSQFPQIEETIAKLDEPASQVMIEAEVLEVSTSLLKNLGVEWSGKFGSFVGGNQTTAFPFGHLPTGVDRAENAKYGIISMDVLSTVLNILEQDTKTKLLARPRILTLNNQTAEIKITSNTAVASTIRWESATAGGITEQYQEPERIETGVTLAVTPTINKNNYITMIVKPEVTEPVTSKFFPGIFVDPHTRSADTTIRVRDGETVVIGGLINSTDTTTKKKIPLLSELPLIGKAFKNNNVDRSGKELIIFITPHIVKDKYYQFATGKLTREIPGVEASSREEAMEKTLKKLK
jgi:type IV pilus secretin PilQ/predicted competence protein